MKNYKVKIELTYHVVADNEDDATETAIKEFSHDVPEFDNVVTVEEYEGDLDDFYPEEN